MAGNEKAGNQPTFPFAVTAYFERLRHFLRHFASSKVLMWGKRPGSPTMTPAFLASLASLPPGLDVLMAIRRTLSKIFSYFSPALEPVTGHRQPSVVTVFQ